MIQLSEWEQQRSNELEFLVNDLVGSKNKFYLLDYFSFSLSHPSHRNIFRTFKVLKFFFFFFFKNIEHIIWNNNIKWNRTDSAFYFSCHWATFMLFIIPWFCSKTINHLFILSIKYDKNYCAFGLLFNGWRDNVWLLENRTTPLFGKFFLSRIVTNWIWYSFVPQTIFVRTTVMASTARFFKKCIE